MATKTNVNPNKIKVRDYMTMNEILRGKGGAHKNHRKEVNKRQCRQRIAADNE